MDYEYGKLSGIYNEAPSWKEFFQIVFFVGVPFSLVIAAITSL